MEVHRTAKALGIGFWTTIKYLQAGQTPDWVAGRDARASRSRDIYGQLLAITKDEHAAIALTRIVDAIMFWPWVIRDRKTKKPIEDEDHPAVALFQNPNPAQDWSQFSEQLVMRWLPTGNGPILLRKLSVMGTPMELWTIRPDKVRTVPDPETFISHYEILGGPTPVTVPVDQMEILKLGNLLDDYLGMGRVGISERLYEGNIAAGEYARKFFENDGTPGFMLKTDKSLSDRAWKRLQEVWKSMHQGARNAHRFRVLEEGLEPADIRKSPKEADFVESRKSWRESIFGIWGLPPIKGGVVEGTNRATAFVQERMFQKDTVAPLLRRMEKVLTKIVKRFDKRLEFAFDDVVQEDQVEDAQISAIYAEHGFITPNEGRNIYAGLPLVKGNPAMDRHYISLSLLPIDEEPAAPPPVVPAPSAEEPKPDGDKPAEPPAVPPAKGAAKAQGGTALQRRVLKSYLRQRAQSEKAFKRSMVALWEGQEDRTIRRFLGLPAKSLASKATAADAWDSLQEDRTLLRLTVPLYVETLQQSFNVTATLLGYDPEKPFEPGQPGFDKTVRTLAAKVKAVNATTQAAVEAVIKQGLDLGLSPTDIANGVPDLDYKGITGTFNEFPQHRAQLIARTESARALDAANVEVYKGLGVQTCDVIGCEDAEVMPGQRWGCQSQGVPVSEAGDIEFHPNHKGAVVPVVGKSFDTAGALGRAQLTEALDAELEVG